eukprot:15034-Heterococcus_DN1.PRE.2
MARSILVATVLLASAAHAFVPAPLASSSSSSSRVATRATCAATRLYMTEQDAASVEAGESRREFVKGSAAVVGGVAAGLASVTVGGAPAPAEAATKYSTAVQVPHERYAQYSAMQAAQGNLLRHYCQFNQDAMTAVCIALRRIHMHAAKWFLGFELLSIKAWQQVQLPVATTLYDIAFDTAEPTHGFVVGAKGTFLE